MTVTSLMMRMAALLGPRQQPTKHRIVPELGLADYRVDIEGTLYTPALLMVRLTSSVGGDHEWFDLSRRLDRGDHVRSFLPRLALGGGIMIEQPYRPDPPGTALADVPAGPIYLHWNPVLAGAIVAAALSFVLLSFGSAIGLSVMSPSSTWRDTSSALALLGGLWLLLTALASFGLGGYLAGRLRTPWSVAVPDEVEFRDGLHGLLVWGLAIIIGVGLTFATARTVSGRADLAAPTASTAEPLLALELDRLFRSDRRPADPGSDTEIRAQAARIITSGLGHTGMAPDDRAYLIRLVAARSGLSQPDAEGRVNQAIAQSSEAVSGARHGAVILAFMIAASLLMGAAVAWLAAAFGGQHRDGAVAHQFWRRWEVDRMFLIR
jgi:hypothetical protein